MSPLRREAAFFYLNCNPWAPVQSGQGQGDALKEERRCSWGQSSPAATLGRSLHSRRLSALIHKTSRVGSLAPQEGNCRRPSANTLEGSGVCVWGAGQSYLALLLRPALRPPPLSKVLNTHRHLSGHRSSLGVKGPPASLLYPRLA